MWVRLFVDALEVTVISIPYSECIKLSNTVNTHNSGLVERTSIIAGSSMGKMMISILNRSTYPIPLKIFTNIVFIIVPSLSCSQLSKSFYKWSFIPYHLSGFAVLCEHIVNHCLIKMSIVL